MEDQERKAKLILILSLICPLLIMIQILLSVFWLIYVPLHLLLLVTEFILAVCVLIAVHGWVAPTWKRLCAIGIMLGVICWSLFWPIAAALISPALVPLP
jgi:hypothetical protein